jgi:germacradienol/geosmin synthase
MLYEKVGPTDLPDIYLPYPTRVSPHHAAALRNSIVWAERMGMFLPIPGSPPIWNARKLAGFDFAICAATINPDATGPELDLSTGWLTWGTYADDYFPATYGRARDMVGAKVFNARLATFLPLDLGATAVPLNAVESGLADLWVRTAEPMSGDARRQFRKAILDMTDSWEWELQNQIQNRVPDPVDYVEMRRKTFGSDLTMSLSRLAHGNLVPPEVYRTRTMQGLDNSAADFACLVNDVFSYQKEIEYEGELNNGVFVVRSFFGCESATAVAIVNDLMGARVRQFERIAGTEMSILFDDFALDLAAREVLTGYVQELKDWMAGVLRWHRETRRYPEAELRRDAAERIPLSRPSGLGVAAARLLEHLGR